MTVRCNQALTLALALVGLSGCGALELQASGNTTAVPTTDTTLAGSTTQAVRSGQDPSLCLDVTGEAQTEGAGIQLWACHYRANQVFSMDVQGLIHVFSSLCLKAGAADAQVTLAACSAADPQQMWLVKDATLVAASSGQCLSAAAKQSLTSGTAVITAVCSLSDAAQSWVIGTDVPTQGSASAADGNTLPTEQDGTGATTNPTQFIALANGAAQVLTSQAAATMASLELKVPTQLKAQLNNIVAAAQAYNIQPQLLVAIAMAESTGGANPAAYSNGGGMFQFTNTDTWKAYGTSKPSDRQNDALSVQAAAKYMAALLNNHNGKLGAALREYNGAVADGGNPNYITEIYANMLGNF